jgi:hypothetical protein
MLKGRIHTEYTVGANGRKNNNPAMTHFNLSLSSLLWMLERLSRPVLNLKPSVTRKQPSQTRCIILAHSCTHHVY